MEDLSAIHKPVPFGWFELLREILAARRAQRLEQIHMNASPFAPALPGDLHHLAGPH